MSRMQSTKCTRRIGILSAALVLVFLGLPTWSEASNCTITGIGLAPSTYVRSSAHTTAGLTAKSGIVPRAANGTPSASGLIGLIGIGMSNARQMHNKLYALLFLTNGGDPDRHPALRFIRAAQSGKTAESWSVAGSQVWATAQTIVMNSGLTRWQIQAAHVVMTQKYPLTSGAMTPGQMQAILANLVAEFPNVRVAYLSGLNYAGYSSVTLVLEPFVHDDSLLLAELIGTTTPTWIDFSDVWADGTTTNPLNGLRYVCEDVDPDGVHLSAPGAVKVASSLKRRWKADPVTQGWMFR